jgi:hypothetical protein
MLEDFVTRLDGWSVDGNFVESGNSTFEVVNVDFR